MTQLRRSRIINVAIFIIVIGIIVISIVELPSGLKPVILVSTLLILIAVLFYKYLSIDNDRFKNLVLVFGACITIISWFITGYFNNRNEENRSKLEFERSTKQSKRDIKVKFLLDAYFRLSNADFRDTFPANTLRELYGSVYIKFAESALTSVQLLGNDSTVRLANMFIMSGGKKYLPELLISLRKELREELALEELPNLKEFNPTVYRSYRNINFPSELTPEQQFQLILKLCEVDRGLIK